MQCVRLQLHTPEQSAEQAQLVSHVWCVSHAHPKSTHVLSVTPNPRTVPSRGGTATVSNDSTAIRSRSRVSFFMAAAPWGMGWAGLRGIGRGRRTTPFRARGSARETYFRIGGQGDGDEDSVNPELPRTRVRG